MPDATFQCGGKTYALQRIDRLGNIGPDELVLMGGKPKKACEGPMQFRYEDCDMFPVVVEVAPASPFAGEGIAYGPDLDGDQLRVRVPAAGFVDGDGGKLIFERETVRSDGSLAGRDRGAYIDPVALHADLGRHLKAMGIQPKEG